MFGPPPVFEPKELTAPAGDAVFFLVNDSPRGDGHGVHTLAIGKARPDAIVVSGEVPGGGRAVFTVHGLPAGTYEIWCTFPAHAGLGQIGTLTVE
jgi:plastocyanin